MAHQVRASTILFLKKFFRDLPEEKEQAFLNRLAPPLRTIYSQTKTENWITDLEENRLVDAALETVMPHEKNGYLSIGRLLAQSTLSGPYRIFMKIPSRLYIFKRVANLWRTFNQDGHASIIGESDNSVTFQISDMPDMLPYHKQFVVSYILTILEYTGAKNIMVSILEDDPNKLRWVAQWD